MSQKLKPPFISLQGQKTLNKDWLAETFAFHANYLLNVEKMLLEQQQNGAETIYVTPKGPAQRKAVYTVAGVHVK